MKSVKTKNIVVPVNKEELEKIKRNIEKVRNIFNKKVNKEDEDNG